MNCIVPGCNNTHVSARFHSFPLTDAALCRTWLRSVRHPVFGPETDLKAVRQQQLKVCSDHFVLTDYEGDRLKDSAVPAVFRTDIREGSLSQSLQETSNTEDAPVATCSQMKEEPTQQDVRMTHTAEESSILKSKVFVNPQCLLELFKHCSVCLVECCVTIEGSERLFSIIQDCQSCGHHREWRSHHNSADECVEAFSEECKDHKEPFHEEHIKRGEVFHEEHLDEDATSFSKQAVLVPHRTKTKEVSMEIKQIIVSLRNEKKSIREIGKTLGLSKSTVGYILKKKASTGDVINRKRSGRPRKTTEEDDQIILSIMMKNPRNPVQQIRNTLKEVGREVSATTIRRKLHSLNHSIETAFLRNFKSSSI